MAKAKYDVCIDNYPKNFQIKLSKPDKSVNTFDQAIKGFKTFNGLKKIAAIGGTALSKEPLLFLFKL
ncbi:hypothetical protein EA772_18540 [Pedobacter sp. G11]|uniref:hypothetical protein n=1 Tax=Pedobacter sp. G11 TaxID=2482728 RepID=UPI000F5D8F2C|nr:hypothetical protein [Pedobacter sp. G11]AZI27237.1 hypothetical protein EA772_18540 [Pedobacter sp. G11]